MTSSAYTPPPNPGDTLRRVLVIKLRHHGDVLLTSPVFTTLKRCAPQAELDALVEEGACAAGELFRLVMSDRPANLPQLHGLFQDSTHKTLLIRDF